MDVFVGIEQAEPINRELAPYEDKKGRAGAADSIGSLHSLAMAIAIGEGDSQGLLPSRPDFADPRYQWQHLRRVYGDTVTHEHRTPKALRMIRCQEGRYGSASGMAQDDRALDLQGIEHIHGLAGPKRKAILTRMVSVAQAEAITVECNDPMLRSEKIRETLLPVRDAAPRSVDQEDGGARADIEDVNTSGSGRQKRSARAPGRDRPRLSLDAACQDPPGYEEQAEGQAYRKRDGDEAFHGAMDASQRPSSGAAQLGPTGTWATRRGSL